MAETIRLDDVGATHREDAGDGRLAGADAAREDDDGLAQVYSSITPQRTSFMEATPTSSSPRTIGRWR